MAIITLVSDENFTQGIKKAHLSNKEQLVKTATIR